MDPHPDDYLPPLSALLETVLPVRRSALPRSTAAESTTASCACSGSRPSAVSAAQQALCFLRRLRRALSRGDSSHPGRRAPGAQRTDGARPPLGRKLGAGSQALRRLSFDIWSRPPSLHRPFARSPTGVFPSLEREWILRETKICPVIAGPHDVRGLFASRSMDGDRLRGTAPGAFVTTTRRERRPHHSFRRRRRRARRDSQRKRRDGSCSRREGRLLRP